MAFRLRRSKPARSNCRAYRMCLGQPRVTVAGHASVFRLRRSNACLDRVSAIIVDLRHLRISVLGPRRLSGFVEVSLRESGCRAHRKPGSASHIRLRTASASTPHRNTCSRSRCRGRHRPTLILLYPAECRRLALLVEISLFDHLVSRVVSPRKSAIHSPSTETAFRSRRSRVRLTTISTRVVFERYAGHARFRDRRLSCLIEEGVLYFVAMIVISVGEFGVALLG